MTRPADSGPPFDWSMIAGPIEPAARVAADAAPVPASRPRRRLDTISAADVRPCAVSWLWDGYLPRGMLTVFDGDPGLGKSTAVCDIAARVTTGAPMPDGSPGTLGDVLVFSAEDSIEQVIVPRLAAAGADMGRVRIVRGSRGPGDDDAVPVTLPDDLGAMEAALPGVALAIVDPLMAYLGGGTDSHRDQDIRRVLAPVAGMADRTRAAFVVVRHLNKAAGGSAIYRGGGSIGIIGAARAAFLFGRDPDDDDLVLMAPTKSNVAALPETMAYRLADARLPGHPEVRVARVEWQGTSGRRADDIIRPRPSDGSAEGGAAVALLRGHLAGGPTAASDIRADAEGRGISWRTVERAKSSLGVVARKVGRPGDAGQHWEWRLPGDGPESPKTATESPKTAISDGVAVFGGLRPEMAVFEPESPKTATVPPEADEPDAWARHAPADASQALQALQDAPPEAVAIAAMLRPTVEAAAAERQRVGRPSSETDEGRPGDADLAAPDGPDAAPARPADGTARVACRDYSAHATHHRLTGPGVFSCDACDLGATA